MDHFVIAAGAYIEPIPFHEPYPEHRWWAALERGARFSFG